MSDCIDHCTGSACRVLGDHVGIGGKVINAPRQPITDRSRSGFKPGQTVVGVLSKPHGLL